MCLAQGLVNCSDRVCTEWNQRIFWSAKR